MKAYITLKSFADNEKAMKMLKSVADEIVVRTETERPKKNELVSLVNEYEILIIGVKEKMDYDIYNASTKLKFLCTLSIGTDHIDKSFFESDIIKVIACSNANVHTVAEFILAYVLRNMKSFEECHRAFIDKSGREGIKHIPNELNLKTIGVIGAGRIAKKFFEITNAFDYKKLCWTFHPQNHNELFARYNIQYADLEYLFESSDYILILIPYSEKTDGLISANLLRKARANTKIINVSRMKIMDNLTFFDMVKNGKFEGSHIDCFPEEILDDQLYQIKNKISLSPHIAGISVESRKRMSEEIAERLIEIVG